jgi:uncharacterized membrane protein YeaQ/YmgE (transglycosylase-associated protein family)
MQILSWIVVGLVAGVLASMIVGGFGLLTDIVVGIAGAFIGSYIFQKAGWHAPFTGLASVTFVAFIGALIVLVVLHAVGGALHSSRWRRRPTM